MPMRLLAGQLWFAGVWADLPLDEAHHFRYIGLEMEDDFLRAVS